MITTSICEDPVGWESFVDSMPEASNYHRWIWRRVIQETYGHAPYYLAATAGGRMEGVLPLVFVKSRLFGDSLVSMPFFSYGGVLARSESAHQALIAKGMDLAQDLSARNIELRQATADISGWHTVTEKVAMGVQIPSDAAEMWNRLNPKIRKRIRHSRKSGLTTCWAGGEAVEDFYGVFATNMRNLGTPVYPRTWFAKICACLDSETRILRVQNEGRTVAAAFVHVFRDTVELPWAASLADSRKEFSTLLLYWTLLEWAAENGYRRVDLGRCTPGSGNYQFKHHWVCEEQPLCWSYWLKGGAAVPHRHADSARFRWAIQTWKHLPLAVANALGPRIVRGMP